MNIEIKLIGEVTDAKMQNVLNALSNGTTTKAAVKEAPAEEKEKTPAKVASKPAAKMEVVEDEAKPAAKPAPKATPAPKVAAKPAPKAEEDFSELDEDAQLEAIKREVTKHTKKGKTADIKQLLSIFDVPKASDLDPATYGEFFDLVKRYGAGETAEDLVESFAV